MGINFKLRDNKSHNWFHRIAKVKAFCKEVGTELDQVISIEIRGDKIYIEFVEE